MLEWEWNAHAETYYATAKVGRKGTWFLIDDGGCDGHGGGGDRRHGLEEWCGPSSKNKISQ